MSIARKYQFTRMIGIWMTATQARPSISGVRNGILNIVNASAEGASAYFLSSHVNIGLAARLLSVAQAQPSVYFLVIGVEYINYLRFAPGACVIELHITQVL